jgi:hypothetical protein
MSKGGDSMKMTELPIPPEAVEAAANAMHDEHWPSIDNSGEACSLCSRYAETAIRAADEARGMTAESGYTVERRPGSHYHGYSKPPLYRLVSRWFPVEEE